MPIQKNKRPILKSLLSNPKWITLEQAVQKRRQLQQKNQKLVLTNGCFDLLHPGHLFFINEAAKLGDQLWIVLNNDTSVRILKGPTRPIQSEEDRAYSLAALSVVDNIITFQTKRVDKEIRILKPDIYVKAGDYSLESIDKAESCALEEVEAKICFLPFLPGYSTTKLIKNICKAEHAL
jgi:D-glycero-beta-D-manno-heptose 1-phosphate adenylyltransferase